MVSGDAINALIWEVAKTPIQLEIIINKIKQM